MGVSGGAVTARKPLILPKSTGDSQPGDRRIRASSVHIATTGKKRRVELIDKKLWWMKEEWQQWLGWSVWPFQRNKKQEATRAVCASTFSSVSGCLSRTGSSTCTDNKALGREGQLKTPTMDQEKNLHAKENPPKPNTSFLYRDTQVLLHAHNQFEKPVRHKWVDMYIHKNRSGLHGNRCNALQVR